MGRTARRRRRCCSNQSSTSQSLEEEESLKQLKIWMHNQNHVFDPPLLLANFKVSNEEDFFIRGVCCQCDLEEKSVLISVSAKLIITPQVAKQELKQVKNLSLDEHACLALFLMQHKRNVEKSQWRSYINSLPKYFAVPLLKSRFSSRLLPTQFRLPLDLQRAHLRRSFRQILKTMPEIKSDFNTFAWAYFAVNTRAVSIPTTNKFYIDPKEDEQNMALIPFLDMFNHSCHAKVVPRLTKNNEFELVSLEKHSKFAQIFINYGPHDNIKLLIEYGFTVDNNPHSIVPVEESEILKVLDLKEKPKLPIDSDMKMNFCAGAQASWSLKLFIYCCFKCNDRKSNFDWPSEAELDGPLVSEKVEILRTFKENEMKAFKEKILIGGYRETCVWMRLVEEQLNILRREQMIK